MALTFEQTELIEKLKQKHKVEFENLRHKNNIEELNVQLEIAKCKMEGGKNE